MCVVSMVHDWGKQQWPYVAPTIDKTEEFKRIMEDLIKKASDIDTKTGQPDCVDPQKAKLIEEIEERLRKLKGL